MGNRFLIVGAGFSGTVLAANLLRRLPAEGNEIVLVERGPEFGRGLAYAIHEYPHLLNVPAGRLSADSKDPLQFLNFAKATVPDASAEDFLPRQLYGTYLQHFLLWAERESPGVILTRVPGEVVRIARQAPLGRLDAEFADGSSIAADGLDPAGARTSGVPRESVGFTAAVPRQAIGAHRRQRPDDGGCGVVAV
jgi:uncharacterized NAD(P)/FAD-binding protein YdhS